MAVTWNPDVCPPEPFCRVQMDSSGNPELLLGACSYHDGLGLSHAGIVARLLDTCRAKEYSRGAAANAIGWDTDANGALHWVLRNDGAVILQTNATGQELQDAQAAVAVVMQNYPDVTLIVE